ncbi:MULTISPECIES: endonuclease domain-containing protein [unclassified Hyphomonas]|uniref:endonuclease domain-containing protein n=1 Tax=unclassified Hyphomonas TaxID=2630699 RepID=UPI000E856828|nr:hypothetical protein [Hyphomonas sp.]HBJ41055.1 hypothetical protein [Hyphomonas sp.]HBT36913.1 hypothetical protein [Hyphomonas sp.]HBX93359.1 hypothetical protein [Hyphomonas sp.]HCE24413.1 hypothetical protein [Hyphomonas sp.]
MAAPVCSTGSAKTRRSHVDHSRRCGTVRGVLCNTPPYKYILVGASWNYYTKGSTR